MRNFRHPRIGAAAEGVGEHRRAVVPYWLTLNTFQRKYNGGVVCCTLSRIS
jgi:hypothetical protein